MYLFCDKYITFDVDKSYIFSYGRIVVLLHNHNLVDIMSP